MFRRIQTKIVSILILIMISILMVIGTFMTTNIVRFYNNEFNVMMEKVFSPNLITQLEISASSNGTAVVWDIVSSYMGPLGIDTYRYISILDAKNGDILMTSDSSRTDNLEKSDNIITAMTGKTGNIINTERSYMDYALPIEVDGSTRYIVYIKDNKNEIDSITQNILFILVEALAFSIIIAIILGYFFSRTITKPIRDLTKSAEKIAGGEFDVIKKVDSNDEIGILSNTFSYMSSALHDTIEEVNSEKTKVETILNNMTDGILAFNLDGGLIHINPEAKKIINRKYYDDIRFDTFFKEIDVDINMGSLLYMKEEPEEKQVTINDKIITFNFVTFIIENKVGGILVVMHDITNRQKLELARREFVANVSHELRTPLTTVKSYAETLMDMPDADPSLSAKFLETIAKEADRMTRIVKDLLTLSRLDEGQYEIKPFERTELSDLVQNISERMYFSAKDKHQKLQFHAPPSPVYLMTDPDKLEQVIINIISNAIKYTPENGEIIVSCGSVYKDAFIKVRDNGIGIPKENLPRIFERFYRVDKARSRETGGTGLGLAIAKQIIDRLGGKISINSTYGEGTEVIINLPL